MRPVCQVLCHLPNILIENFVEELVLCDCYYDPLWPESFVRPTECSKRLAFQNSQSRVFHSGETWLKKNGLTSQENLFYQSLVNISAFDFWFLDVFGNLLRLDIFSHVAYVPHLMAISVNPDAGKHPKKTAQFLARGRLHPWEVTALYMFPYRGARWDFLTPSMTIRSMRLGKPWVEWQVVPP